MVLFLCFSKFYFFAEFLGFETNVISIHHYGLLDSFFFQAASISHSGFPWVSESPQGPTELDFKGSGCDPEVLGVLEPINFKTRPNLTKKSPFLTVFGN